MRPILTRCSVVTHHGVLWPKVHNLNLIMRNHWQTPTEGNSLPKCQGHERQGKTGNVADWKRFRKCDNEVQSMILNWILDQEKDMNGKTGDIRINCLEQLIMFYQC